jgi:hypothetical protein
MLRVLAIPVRGPDASPQVGASISICSRRSAGRDDRDHNVGQRRIRAHRLKEEKKSLGEITQVLCISKQYVSFLLAYTRQPSVMEELVASENAYQARKAARAD